MNPNKIKCVICSMAVGCLLLAGLYLVLNGSIQPARADPVDFFVTPGGSGNCSQASPCDLQTAVSTASDDDTLYVAHGIYTGSGTVVVSITRSISLMGGWNGSPEGPIIRDALTYTSTLDGEGLRRVIYVSENTTPTIDGFTITGGDATGLGGGVFDDGDAGGGIYSLHASPVIHNNLIIDNVASTLTNTRAFGGGIYVESITRTAVIRENHFISNTAGIEISEGDGGGVFINSAADVAKNIFRENIACRNCGYGFGGGLQIVYTTRNFVVANNIFENNQARDGGAVSLFWSAAQISGNTIKENTATEQGGGFYSWYDMGSTIYANTIMSNTANDSGGGIGVRITGARRTIFVENNFIAGNQAGGLGGGLRAYSDWNHAFISMKHNTLVNNGMAVAIGYNMTATLVNNIVASHTLGITVTAQYGHVDADHTLFWSNLRDGIQDINPVFGDPAFVNTPMNDYHIGKDSAAVDNGVNAGVSTDIDWHRRPIGAGFDIGADEYSINVYTPVVMRNL